MKKIIVSACLIGTPCRYDGKSKPCEAVIALGEKYELVPVCPECLGGLPTPRLPCEIRDGRVWRIDGRDCTHEYTKGAEKSLEIARENGADTAIFKAKSPSCGKHQIYDGTYSGTLISGQGIASKLFMENGIRVLDEEELEKL